MELNPGIKDEVYELISAIERDRASLQIWWPCRWTCKVTKKSRRFWRQFDPVKQRLEIA